MGEGVTVAVTEELDELERGRAETTEALQAKRKEFQIAGLACSEVVT